MMANHPSTVRNSYVDGGTRYLARAIETQCIRVVVFFSRMAGPRLRSHRPSKFGRACTILPDWIIKYESMPLLMCKGAIYIPLHSE